MKDYHEDIRERFLAAISSKDRSGMAEITKWLALSPDPNIKKLAIIAESVFSASSVGGTPAELEKGISAFDLLPDTSFWCQLMDDASCIVLGRALTMEKDSKARPELLRYGLTMAGRAISPGFPLSEKTAALIRELRKEGGAPALVADAISRMNESLTPPKNESFRPKAPEQPPARGNRGTRTQ